MEARVKELSDQFPRSPVEAEAQTRELIHLYGSCGENDTLRSLIRHSVKQKLFIFSGVDPNEGDDSEQRFKFVVCSCSFLGPSTLTT